MTGNAAAAVEVVDAVKIIDGVTVLDGVSFDALPGRVTAFLGPNGAGKSTMLRALLGIDRLTSGTATIGGLPFAAHATPLRVAGALLTPDAAHPRRTARGHLQVVAASNGLPASRVDALLEVVGIADIAELPVGQMSLGMRQRLGLATALIGDPSVVILDEPHNGLDAAAIRWLRGVLRVLADAGRTVLVSSHLMSEVQLMADDIVVIDKGRIVHSSPIAKFKPVEKKYLDLVGGAS